MGRKRQKPHKIVDINTLEQINLNAAGIDIHQEEHWVSVPSGRDEQSVRCFGTMTDDLEAIAQWLHACGVETVAMESTSVYWIPLYDKLEAEGFQVYLVNARATKNVAGRKSDVLDCQWIQQLHTYGLLQSSFRPPAEIVTLRTYVRHRENVLSYRARHIQQMQKALELMNVKLTSVISDITGLTGMQIIRAIINGERDPMVLAEFRDPRCHKTKSEIARALYGNYAPEHIFLLSEALDSYEHYTRQLAKCDAQLEAQYARIQPQVDIQLSPLPENGSRIRRRKQANHPNYDLRTCLYQLCGVDLTTCDGIDVLLAQDIVAEVGLDMSKWCTERHFTSWLGLAPNNRSSAGKVKSRRSKRTKSRANLAFPFVPIMYGRSKCRQKPILSRCLLSPYPSQAWSSYRRYRYCPQNRRHSLPYAQIQRTFS